MEEHFSTIKKKYDEFRQDLLKEGKLMSKDTGVGFWGISVMDELYDLFRKIDLSEHHSFIDLGSGDGRVVLLASLFTKKAHGIEYDDWLVSVSKHMKKMLSPKIPHVNKAEFFKKDYMDHDVSDYDVVFMNPDKPFHRGLDRKMVSELTGSLVLFGPHYHPNSLERHDVHDVGTMVSLYRNPVSEQSYAFHVSKDTKNTH